MVVRATRARQIRFLFPCLGSAGVLARTRRRLADGLMKSISLAPHQRMFLSARGYWGQCSTFDILT